MIDNWVALGFQLVKELTQAVNVSCADLAAYLRSIGATEEDVEENEDEGLELDDVQLVRSAMQLIDPELRLSTLLHRAQCQAVERFGHFAACAKYMTSHVLTRCIHRVYHSY